MKIKDPETAASVGWATLSTQRPFRTMNYHPVKERLRGGCVGPAPAPDSSQTVPFPHHSTCVEYWSNDDAARPESMFDSCKARLHTGPFLI